MSQSTQADILAAYADNAPKLIDRYTRLDAAVLLEPVRTLMPPPPARVLDIGAGPGRDAAWFAGQGYEVTALEPVAAFRRAGQSLTGSRARWIDDRLPDLTAVGEEKFDLVYVMAVWQHLPPGADTRAFDRIRQLMAKGARAVISLRFGPGHPERPVFAIDRRRTLERARSAGFEILADFNAPGLQRESQIDGVTWRWLVLGA